MYVPRHAHRHTLPFFCTWLKHLLFYSMAKSFLAPEKRSVFLGCGRYYESLVTVVTSDERKVKFSGCLEELLSRADWVAGINAAVSTVD